MLIRAQTGLVEGVGHVKRRPGRLHVQVERVRAARVCVDPIEEREVVAFVVQGLELWRVEKPIGPCAAQRQEVADGVAAPLPPPMFASKTGLVKEPYPSDTVPDGFD